MNNNMDKVSLGLFIVVIICFMLPFAGAFIFSVSGLDLAKGIAELDIGPNPLVIVSLLAAVAGAAMFFWKARASQVLQVVAGILGGVLLIVLKMAFDSEAEGAIQWLTGYYLAVLGFFAAAVVNVLAMKKNNE